MTPLDVLSTIRQAGGRVVVLDGDLQVIAPPGTVSVEAAAVLREHKAALIGILPDAEREAVRWVEDLAPAAAEAVVEATSREWEEIVGSTQEPEPVVEPDLDQQAEPVEFTTPEGLTIRFADPEDEEEVSSSLRHHASNAAGLWHGGTFSVVPIAAVRAGGALTRVREQADGSGDGESETATEFDMPFTCWTVSKRQAG